MPALESALTAAINRLLGDEPGARAELIPHAGKVVEVRAAGLPALRFAIGSDGMLGQGPPDATPAVWLRLGPEALFALAQDGGLPGERFVAALDSHGERELAGVLESLAKHLRWDAEAALARVFGDIAARRIAGTGRDILAWQAHALGRVGTALTTWQAEEKRLLLGRAEHADFSRSLQDLGAAIDRLAERTRELKPRTRELKPRGSR